MEKVYGRIKFHSRKIQKHWPSVSDNLKPEVLAIWSKIKVSVQKFVHEIIRK